MIKDLEIIKKKYGEDFAKFCRSSFSTLLETEGLLPKILKSTFAPTRSLYHDIVKNNLISEFKNYIYGFAIKIKENNTEILETPEELFDKVGYKLYKCETAEQINYFQKYYCEDEMLCTFRDSGRIKTHTVFFAVKKDVDNIKRENFLTPRRQDEYGTSVISLQFTKCNFSTLSIKNRYNHSVPQCDATFSNDLENICSGLTASFKKYYGINPINQKQDFQLFGYVRDINNVFYKNNVEIDNCYYCENNIVIKNGVAKQYDKSQYDVIEYFILDKVNKSIHCDITDGFTSEFNNIEKIDIVKNKLTNERTFYVVKKDNTSFQFTVNNSNEIISYINEYQTKLEKSFLHYNEALQNCEIPNLEKMEKFCLSKNLMLEKLNFPKLKIIENFCLFENKRLTEFNAPQLNIMGAYFLSGNTQLKCLDLPNLQIMRDYCLHENKKLTTLNAPNLQKIANYCLYFSSNITKLNIPKNCFIGYASLNNHKLKIQSQNNEPQL